MLDLSFPLFIIPWLSPVSFLLISLSLIVGFFHSSVFVMFLSTLVSPWCGVRMSCYPAQSLCTMIVAPATSD
ncbi:hypothetical protein BP00DRAFT_110687 [Aspergillus indologenus CBS 114.80]|uniref:Uncharacterized protein n=1 Tax=Aspergillus indologenus CBS 114.80 TaxID=1450541 RepID=A0A2V5IQT5_9EURO|nr:hypothetical protein BP00DRAFT_110687 [Aspergillus indologenus CBS 114.80]